MESGDVMSPARSAALILVGAALGCGLAARAQQPPQPGELLEKLNGVSVDPAEIYVLRNAQIVRDRVRIYFNRGFVGFFKKVGGETTGAVFSGEGEVLLFPPDAIEKRNLAQFTQSPILEEQFTSIYMRFTDRTAEELRARARPPDPDDPEQPEGFLQRWNSLVGRLSPGFSLRLLQDLLGDRSAPFFQAHVFGTSLESFEVSVDEREPEAVRVGRARRSHGSVFADVWCSFPSKLSESRAGALKVGSAEVRSYKIETRIHEDNSLEGRASLELESRSGADRMLVFELSRFIKVSEVTDERGEPVTLFQNPSLEESEAAARGNDWMVIVLARPRPVGETYRLNFAYQGNVITDVGNGVLYVGARGSWYPNRAVGARATYDLTFHYPDRLTLVATGTRLEESSAGGWKHSRWVSDGRFAVAGFNLGNYDMRTRRAGATAVEVYAAREVEESLEKRHLAAHSSAELIIRDLGEGKRPVGVIAKSVAPLEPAALLDHVAENAARAVVQFEKLFGPFPYPRLAIAQIPGRFGQGWPELVYLPTLYFLEPRERSALGLERKSDELEGQLGLAHEVAHQWWGNQVGWNGYRDQWLSEGFATYAAALALAEETNGERKFRDLMRAYKRELLEKNPEGNTVVSGGPIWLGRRLSTSLNPKGYDDIVYKKACWVLHMLRVLMTDPVTGSDQKFFKMLRDFLVAYRDQDPSTEDFIRHAEKYMGRSMDLERNRRLDWFFADWVYGAGIPSYKLQSSTRRLASKQYVTEGTIEQSGVPADFEMLVPVVASYGREKKKTLFVAVGETAGRFRLATATKPTRVAIDEENLLAVVR